MHNQFNPLLVQATFAILRLCGHFCCAIGLVCIFGIPRLHQVCTNCQQSCEW